MNKKTVTEKMIERIDEERESLARLRAHLVSNPTLLDAGVGPIDVLHLMHTSLFCSSINNPRQLAKSIGGPWRRQGSNWHGEIIPGVAIEILGAEPKEEEKEVLLTL